MDQYAKGQEENNHVIIWPLVDKTWVLPVQSSHEISHDSLLAVRVGNKLLVFMFHGQCELRVPGMQFNTDKKNLPQNEKILKDVSKSCMKKDYDLIMNWIASLYRKTCEKNFFAAASSFRSSRTSLAPSQESKTATASLLHLTAKSLHRDGKKCDC